MSGHEQTTMPRCYRCGGTLPSVFNYCPMGERGSECAESPPAAGPIDIEAIREAADAAIAFGEKWNFPPDERRIADYCRDLLAEVERLKAAIREHRDQRGDDRCWTDDRKLYEALGEPVPPDAQALPPKADFLASCERYYEQRRCPLDQYPPGRMRLAELEAEVERLRAQPASAVARSVAALEAEAAGLDARAEVLHAEGRSALAEERRAAASLFRRAARIADRAGEAEAAGITEGGSHGE